MPTRARTPALAAAHPLEVAVWVLSREGSFSRADVAQAFHGRHGVGSEAARKDWDRVRDLLKRNGVRLVPAGERFTVERRRCPPPGPFTAAERELLASAVSRMRDAEDAMIHAHLRRAFRKLLVGGLSLAGTEPLLEVPLRPRWTREDVLKFEAKEALARGQRLVALVQEHPADDAETVVLEVSQVDAVRKIVKGRRPDGRHDELYLPFVKELRRVQRGEAIRPTGRRDGSAAARRPPLVPARELLASAFLALAFLQRAGSPGLTPAELRALAGLRTRGEVTWVVRTLTRALRRAEDGLLGSIEIRSERGRYVADNVPSPLELTLQLSAYEAAALIRAMPGPRDAPARAAAARKLVAAVREPHRALAEQLSVRVLA